MPPPEATRRAVTATANDPVAREEGAAFAAFMGAHSSLASRVKGG